MRVPASIRNNNPGAQYPGKSAKKFGSTKHEVLKSKDGVHKIATFPTSIQGAAAQFDLLSSPAYTGRTIEQAIQKWCGGFYVSTYIKVLEAEGGISRRTTLTRDLLCDASIAIPLAKAMALQEAGREYPMSDEDWARAHAMAFPEAKPVEELPPAPTVPKDEFDPGNDIPSPKPETRVKTALKESKTILGVLIAALGVIIDWFSGIMAGLGEAASHIAGWSSGTSVLAALGVDLRGITFAMTIGGLALVLVRRLQAAKNGKEG